VAEVHGRHDRPTALVGLVRAADMLETPGEALDVGVGAGRDTSYLLSRGWRVTALDSSPSASDALERLAHRTWSTPSSRCRSSHASISKRRSGVSVTRYGAAASWRRSGTFFIWSRATVSSSPTLSRELRIKKVTLRPNEVDDA